MCAFYSPNPEKMGWIETNLERKKKKKRKTVDKNSVEDAKIQNVISEKWLAMNITEYDTLWILSCV